MPQSILTFVFLFLMGPATFAHYAVLKLKFQPATKVALKSSALFQMKEAENSKNWKKCAGLSDTALKSHQALRGWILLAELKCSYRHFLETKETKEVLRTFKKIELSEDLMHKGPWADQLESDYLRNKISVAEVLVKSNPVVAWQLLDGLIERKSQLSKSQLSKVYLMMSDLAQSETKLKWALELAQYSIAEADSVQALEKLKQLQLALSQEKPEKPNEQDELYNEKEAKFEERLKASVKSADNFNLAEDCAAYLKALPGGRKSKWCFDKLLEIHQNLFLRTDDAKYAPSMERFLNIVDHLEVSRVGELSRTLHRRGDFAGSLKLALKAYSGMEDSKEASILLYVIGRSSQFLGQYANARKYFQIYLERFSASEDVNEVLFRLGLVFIRLSDTNSAIATFEKLLNLKNVDRYELSARYWLFRCLQWTSNPRAEAELNLIFEKSLLSYYGLKAKLEKQKNVSDWPSSLNLESELKGELYFTRGQKKAWDRVQTLANHGWSHEAYLEFLDLPAPVDADLKVLLAGELSKNRIYPPIIRLVQGATEANSSFRAFDVVSLALPKPFDQVIESNAKLFKVSPILVRSLMRQESAFNIQAVSTSSAFGLMQIIAPTAEEVIRDLGLKQTTVPDDLFIPEVNIKLGTSYIAKMLSRFSGQVPFALAAYNAGPSRVKLFIEARPEVKRLLNQPSADPYDELWMDELPWFETSFYVKSILRNSILYRLAEKASEKSPENRKVTFSPILWSDLVSN